MLHHFLCTGLSIAALSITHCKTDLNRRSYKILHAARAHLILKQLLFHDVYFHVYQQLLFHVYFYFMFTSISCLLLFHDVYFHVYFYFMFTNNFLLLFCIIFFFMCYNSIEPMTDNISTLYFFTIFQNQIQTNGTAL